LGCGQPFAVTLWWGSKKAGAAAYIQQLFQSISAFPDGTVMHDDKAALPNRDTAHEQADRHKDMLVSGFVAWESGNLLMTCT